MKDSERRIFVQPPKKNRINVAPGLGVKRLPEPQYGPERRQRRTPLLLRAGGPALAFMVFAGSIGTVVWLTKDDQENSSEATHWGQVIKYDLQKQRYHLVQKPKNWKPTNIMAIIMCLFTTLQVLMIRIFIQRQVFTLRFRQFWGQPTTATRVI